MSKLGMMLVADGTLGCILFASMTLTSSARVTASSNEAGAVDPNAMMASAPRDLPRLSYPLY